MPLGWSPCPCRKKEVSHPPSCPIHWKIRFLPIKRKIETKAPTVMLARMSSRIRSNYSAARGTSVNMHVMHECKHLNTYPAHHDRKVDGVIECARWWNKSWIILLGLSIPALSQCNEEARQRNTDGVMRCCRPCPLLFPGAEEKADEVASNQGRVQNRSTIPLSSLLFKRWTLQHHHDE